MEPIYHDEANNQSYLLFDELCISQERGVIKTEFRLQGKTHYTMNTDGDMATGQIFTLAGFQGRVPFKAG